MLFKVVLIFLLAMVLVGMIGKVLFPNRMDRLTKLKRKALKAPTCPRCGRYIIGRSGCDCRKS